MTKQKWLNESIQLLYKEALQVKIGIRYVSPVVCWSPTRI